MRYKVLDSSLTKSELEYEEEKLRIFRMERAMDFNPQTLKDNILYNNVSYTYREFMETIFLPKVIEEFGEMSPEVIVAEYGTDKGDTFKSVKWKDSNNSSGNKAYLNIYNKLLDSYYE